MPSFRPLVALLVALAPGPSAAEQLAGAARQVAAEFARPLAEAPLRSFVEAELSLRRPDGTAVEGATLTISGGMPAHGHGLPTTPRAEELGGGRYLIRGLKFTMPGDWELAIAVEAPGLSDRVVLAFRL
ncbi:FixH family protein (plasmid) [Cereibacter azotoformans]|uniref:FixH family protein n=1 Tax=Cereibacter azotoformans TaxID=43057 RepID=UPI001EEA24ED|nr:FixH family protein [Cereibacter azotoformans]ULB12069.1 FixH family protein [Cereibacter azotoformans]